MRTATAAALASLLALAGAHDHTWVTDTCFPRPGNTDNHCSEHQQRGFDWSGLGNGPFSSYGGLGFSGFSCSDRSGHGRRSGWDSGKCIEGEISSDSGPSISCGQDQSGFSISDLHLSTTKHTDVHIHYDMPDGSTCKQVASCSPEGTYATNDQCGGATSVSFHLPHDSEHHGCGLSIHHIGFDCGHGSTTPPGSSSSSVPVIVPPFSSAPGYSSPPVYSSPPAYSSPSVPGVLPTSSSAPVYSSPSVPVVVPPFSSAPGSYPSPSSSPSLVTSPPASSPAQSTPAVTPSSTPPQMTTSTVYTTSEITITSCAPTVTNCPAGSTTVVTSTIAISTTVCPVTQTQTPSSPSSVAPVSSSPLPAQTSPPSNAPVGSSSSPGESTTTVVTYETVTTCPVTATTTSGGSTLTTTYTTESTVTTTSVSTICPQCSATPIPSGSSPAVTPPESSSVAPVSSSPPEESTTTVVTYETVTTCPVTSTVTSGGSTLTTTYTTESTVTTTSVSTICLQCSATTTPSGSSPTGTTVPSVPCPNSVPKCINTWLTLMPKCNSNSDSSCFCPSSEFTDKVISCIRAWGASKEEVQRALSYFTGICGAYVPQNPGIVTAIPTTITLVPTVAPSGAAAQTNPPPCTTISYASYTVTVPQVQFTTGSSGPSPTVGLVAASPSQTPAPSQPVIPSGFATSTAAAPSGAGPSASSPPPVFNNSASGLAVSASAGLLVTVVATVVGLLL